MAISNPAWKHPNWYSAFCTHALDIYFLKFSGATELTSFLYYGSTIFVKITEVSERRYRVCMSIGQEPTSLEKEKLRQEEGEGGEESKKKEEEVIRLEKEKNEENVKKIDEERKKQENKKHQEPEKESNEKDEELEKTDEEEEEEEEQKSPLVSYWAFNSSELDGLTDRGPNQERFDFDEWEDIVETLKDDPTIYVGIFFHD